MYEGIPSEGLEFYSLLCEDDEFCAEFGRAMLAAGRLESALKKMLTTHAPDENTRRATLGRLITYARKNNLLEKMIPSLEMLCNQRNYLAHNIHALFSGQIEETILQRTDLLDSDVPCFTERAWQLKENLNGLSEIIERKHNIGPEQTR